uniref:ER vesicle protein n=1 Tax=Starmerella bombicola TaxID=75736 RepID=A0A0U1YP67_STABO|nr:ER vesicle protein [Starmerella bombicola]
MQAFLLAWLLSVVSALKFELDATTGGNTRCIRDFVGSETLVVVKVKASGSLSDGQRLSMVITDSKDNRFAFRDNVVDKAYQTFSPTKDTSFDVCFTNHLDRATGSGGRRYREIDLDVQVGTNARDWQSYQAAEKLKPTELVMRQLNDKVEELYNDLEYLRLREERLRDTNESTNARVKSYFFMILLSFFALGAWQITYLRSYFRSKHII